MQIPSVEDVNATRLSRFDESITEALGSDRLEFFRQVVTHYVNEFDVPEVDVAAALALQAQGEQPLLLDPAAEPKPFAPREDRPHREFDDRPPPRAPKRGEGPPLSTYKIAVGKRHRITPRHIVGALANEGGLRREDFGHIDIRLDYSLIELPADLPQATWDALGSTRISGKLIELSPATGATFTRDKGKRDGGYERRPPRASTRGTEGRLSGKWRQNCDLPGAGVVDQLVHQLLGRPGVVAPGDVHPDAVIGGRPDHLVAGGLVNTLVLAEGAGEEPGGLSR